MLDNLNSESTMLFCRILRKEGYYILMKKDKGKNGIS